MIYVERGDCGEDLLGIAATPPLLSLCWSRDRTNHVLVIRLETAADQEVFLSSSSSPFPVRFSALFFLIAVCVFGALTFTGPDFKRRLWAFAHSHTMLIVCVSPAAQ